MHTWAPLPLLAWRVFRASCFHELGRPPHHAKGRGLPQHAVISAVKHVNGLRNLCNCGCR